MAQKEIIWSLRANRELLDQLEFFTERNGSDFYSLKMLDEIENLTLRLSEHELMGRPTTKSPIRVLVYDIYLIFYEIHENCIKIVSFWNNLQDSSTRVDSNSD